MFKQQSNRNPRNQGGFKLKHVLHICLLLAVCAWLIYQVGNSYYKKKEFDDGNQKPSEKVAIMPEVLNLGRKDLNDPGFDKAYGDENKEVPIEDERRGGGDDEIDERRQEKDREEAEQINEDFKENVKRDGQIEEVNSQEAREEQYNGDDASNGVNKDAQLIAKSESENGESSNSDEEQGRNTEKSDDSSNQTENNENSVNGEANNEEKGSTEVNLSESDDGSRSNSDTESINQTEGKGSTEVSLSETEGGSRRNSDAESIKQIEEKGNTEVSLSELEDESRRDSNTESNDQKEENNKSDLEDGSLGNSDTESNDQKEERKNSTENAESPDLSLQNQTLSLDFIQEDKSKLEAIIFEEKIEISNTTSTENGSDDGSISSTNNTMVEKTESDQNATDSDEDKKNVGTIVLEEQTDNSNTIGKADESVDGNVSSVTTSENGDTDHRESNDTSSSPATQEEKEAPKDLGILPEGENGVKNGEDVSV